MVGLGGFPVLDSSIHTGQSVVIKLSVGEFPVSLVAGIQDSGFWAFTAVAQVSVLVRIEILQVVQGSQKHPSVILLWSSNSSIPGQRCGLGPSA